MHNKNPLCAPVTYKRINHLTELLQQFAQQNKQNKQNKQDNEVPNTVIESVTKYFYENHIPITEISRNKIRIALKDLKLRNYYEYTNSIFNRLSPNESIINEIEQSSQEVRLSKEIECPVCFEEISNVIRLYCNHEFCSDCIEKIKSVNVIKCPLCRSEHKIKTKKHNKTYVKNLTPEQAKKIKEDFKDCLERYNKVSENSSRTNMLNYNYVLYKLAEKNNIPMDPDMLLKNPSKLSYHNQTWKQMYDTHELFDTDYDTDSEIDYGSDSD